MRVLQAKLQPPFETSVKQCEHDPYFWRMHHGDLEIPLPMVLRKENNRGWTFNNHTITGSATTFFFSRGDFEMIETKENKNLKN